MQVEAPARLLVTPLSVESRRSSREGACEPVSHVSLRQPGGFEVFIQISGVGTGVRGTGDLGRRDS